MGDSLSRLIKQEIDTIKIPESKLNAVMGNAIKMGHKTQKTFGKKNLYFSTVAVILITIFIGAGFVSPATADVVSKLPFLKQLFQSTNETNKFSPFISSFDLQKAGYNVTNVSVRYQPDKVVWVFVGGSKQYYNNVKKDVEEYTLGKLQSLGMDALKVTVVYDNDNRRQPQETKEDKEYIRQSENLQQAIMEELKKQNYGIQSVNVRINNNEKFIPLEVLVTENRITEMKKIINDIISKQKLGKFTIQVNKIDPEKQTMEQRWSPIFSTLANGMLGRKQYQVISFGYSMEPSAILLKFKVSINSTEPDAHRLGEKIQDEVNKFIHSDVIGKTVQNDPYKIIVLSKDNKKIN